MAFIYREWRVLAASIFAVAAIGGAYLLAQGAAAPRVAQASTESALLEQIANKDSTGDGLPDWQKALYGIPLNATSTDYFHLGMTDGEAVAKGLIVPIASTPTAPVTTPGTGTTAASFGLTAPGAGSLTDTFAQNFFALYMNASQNSGGSLSDDQINGLASQALTELSASVTPAPDYKTAADIKVSGSGADAMRTYAINAEAIFAAHPFNAPAGELAYLQDYLNGDQTALSKIQGIGTAYQAIAIGLAALAVPQEAAATHLALVNALMHTGQSVTDLGNVYADPLVSMLALQQYPQYVLMLSNAFAAVTHEFAAEGLVFPAGAPGASFVNLADEIRASQTP